MTTFRAKVTLEKVEPYTDGHGYAREQATELSSHTVTGATPADAMVQLCAHADSLYEWHQQQAEEAAPVLDEAFRLGPPAYDLSKLFKDIFVVPPHRHVCAVCGKPGPVKHEGNSYVCPDCNAAMEKKLAEPDQLPDSADDEGGENMPANMPGVEAENEPAFEADPLAHCHVPVDGGYCHRPYRHEGRCSTKGDPIPKTPAEAGLTTSPESEGEQQQ